VSEIERMHNVLKERFNIKVLGRISFALGISFQWSNKGVCMSQTAYIERIASHYNMENAKPTSVPILKGTKLLHSDCPTDETEIQEMRSVPYRNAIGSLLYVALGT